MLIAFNGASGTGKSTIINSLNALGIESVGPPIWNEFDDFAADPRRYAMQNQRAALHAHVQVTRQGLQRPGVCVTDASLDRVRIFSQVLRSAGYLTNSQHIELLEEDRALTQTIDQSLIENVHLICAEFARQARTLLRGLSYLPSEEFRQIQHQMDAAQITRSLSLASSPGHRIIRADAPVDQVVCHVRTAFGLL